MLDTLHFPVICRPHICMCTQLFMSAIITESTSSRSQFPMGHNSWQQTVEICDHTVNAGKMSQTPTKCFQVICRPHICIWTQLFMSAIITESTSSRSQSPMGHLTYLLHHVNNYDVGCVWLDPIWIPWHINRLTTVIRKLTTTTYTLLAAVSRQVSTLYEQQFQYIVAYIVYIFYICWLYYGETNVWWIEGVSQWNGQETALDISTTSLNLFDRW